MAGDGAAVATTVLNEVEALAEEIAGFAAQVDAANCDLLIRLREFDELEGWAHLGFRSCAHWLRWRTGMAPATARQRVRVARELGKFPRVERAMKSGDLSYSKVRAIVRVATAETEQDYLDLAMHSTAAHLERVCAACSKRDPEEHDDRPQRFVRRRDLDGGLVRIEIQLPREDADVVWEAISQATAAPAPRSENDSAESSDAVSGAPAEPANDPPSTEERRADAIVTLAEASLSRTKSFTRFILRTLARRQGDPSIILRLARRFVHGRHSVAIWRCGHDRLRLRRRSRSSRRGRQPAQHRPPFSGDPTSSAPRTATTRPRLCLPRVYGRSSRRRSPHRALGQRRPDLSRQPRPSVSLSPPSGA